MQNKISKLFAIMVVLAMVFAITASTSGNATAARLQSISLTGGAYTQDFNTLSNTAGSTTNVLSITDWYMTETGGGARDNEQYAVDTGASTTGDTYSYGSTSATDRALGGLQSGTLIPTFGAEFINNTGGTITDLSISYNGEQWRLGTLARTDRLDFQYSLDATSLTTGTWNDVDTLDFTAPVTGPTTGSLNGNTAANRTAVSSTITSLSIANGATFWIRWTDLNATGADDGLAVDDFSITPTSTGGGGVDLSINDVTLTEGNAGTTTFQFTVSLSSPAPVGGVTFDIATQDNTATTADNDYVLNSLTSQTIAAGNSSYLFNVTVNGDTNVEANESFYVNVTNVTGTGVTVIDGQGTGNITNDDILITKTHDVQGSGSASPIVGSTVTVEAIVVGDYQEQGINRILGFYLQEEDADADADPATSEGLFIYCNTCPTAVSLGDKVQVTGAVSEFNGMTEITASTAGSVVVVSTGNTLPTAATITLPVPGVPTGDLAAATTVINAYYEQFEGMLANFPSTLYVSEYFELARYGQVELTQGGRMHTFTGVNTPSAAGYIDHQIEMATRMIVLDDMDNRQNRPVDVPNTAYFYPTPGFSTSNYFRGGDTITGMTGVLDWYASAWRVRPVNGYSYTFTPANLRPTTPAASGTLKVASFNVLNYFLTVDTTSSSSSGPCGPALTADCRGADSAAEFNTQRAKLLAALTAIDADVFGFMEMENTPSMEPLANIVAGLPGYDYIDTGVIGTDTIRVGIIYKTSAVTPVGTFAVLDSAAFVDPNSTGTDRNRPALAQTFDDLATGGRFTVVVNHLKSKGCSTSPALDTDQSDGQGCWNDTRTKAAQELLAWIATDPTGSNDPDFLIIGDLNSYAMEDPITAIKNGGFTDLVNLFGGTSAYGYVFDGQLGYLDHALANASLTPQVAGTLEWHINADENPLFDYNDDVKDTGESSFEEESDTNSLYNTDIYRTSDHDPVVIGLNLDGTPPTINVPANITEEATSASGAAVSYLVTVSDGLDPNPTLTCSPLSGSTFPIGTTTVVCSASDYAGNASMESFTVTVEDTTPPSLTLPVNIIAEATSAAGRVVSYSASASDAVGVTSFSCAPASGSTFPLGTTNVNCSASDAAGNPANASFSVTIVDTTSPTLNIPANMTVAQSSPAGAVVNFSVTASDLVDANPSINCTPPSGSTFPVGTTTVNCSATDDYSNTSNGSFTVSVVAWSTASFISQGAYDGTIFETMEASGVGGAPNISGGFLDVGDMTRDRQVKSLMHFDTSTLPDGAVVTGISLQLKRYQIVGTNPFTLLGDLNVDIASPYFGVEMAFRQGDFQATASEANVGIFNPAPLAGNWYEATLGSAAFPHINLTGPTQFRLHFTLDDNDDLQNDFIRFYSGNAPIAGYRPVLVVYYYIP